jgi:hypothetical protein
LAPRGLPVQPDAVPLFLRTRDGHDPQPPVAREVRALTLALEALSGFFDQYGARLRRQSHAGPLEARISVAKGTRTILVQWPG